MRSKEVNFEGGGGVDTLLLCVQVVGRREILRKEGIGGKREEGRKEGGAKR